VERARGEEDKQVNVRAYRQLRRRKEELSGNRIQTTTRRRRRRRRRTTPSPRAATKPRNNPRSVHGF